MSDIAAGSAPAPAEVTGAPVDLNPPSHTPPLGSQIPEKVTPEGDKAEKPSQTNGEALRKALVDSKAKDAAKEPAKVDPKAVAKEPPKVETEAAKAERIRAENGRYVPADKPADTQAKPAPLTAEQQRINAESPHREPPARFSPDAKAAWETAPEAIRAETHRAIRELEQGHQKYKADAEAYHETREYDEMAKQSGTTLKKALFNYTSMENVLRKDPIAGLEMVMKHIGMKTPEGRVINLRDVAEHIMSQSPEESQARQNNQAVQSEITDLRQQVSGLMQHIQQQQTQSVTSQIDGFAKDNPRFDELSQDIAFFLQSGRASSLPEAYEMADRLNPASSPASTQQQVIPAAAHVPKPLNPAGQKSISGAPSAGSDPAQGPPSSSNREALKRALARA